MSERLMLAATYTQGGAFAVDEVPSRRSASDEMLLRVSAASICGTDVKIIRSGHRKLADGQRIVLGHEFVGIIEQRRVARSRDIRSGSGWASPQCGLRPLRRLHPRQVELLPAVHGLWDRSRRRPRAPGEDSRPVRDPGQRHPLARGRVGSRGRAAGAVFLRGQWRARLAGSNWATRWSCTAPGRSD